MPDKFKICTIYSFLALTVNRDYSQNGYKFWTSDGNLAVWWASEFLYAIDENGEQHQVVVGDVVRLKATIKRHDEFRGVKQTIITRANVLQLVRAENQENKKAVA